MAESLLLITLFTIVILAIRRGKPVILDNPVNIERPGQYHITLAPQLNQAQKFVESIAKQFKEVGHSAGDLPTQYFEVRDPLVLPKNFDCYLLAVALRDGMLYIQAINPQPITRDADSHYQTVREFSDKVLAFHPVTQGVDEKQAVMLGDAVASAAAPLSIVVKRLYEAD